MITTIDYETVECSCCYEDFNCVSSVAERKTIHCFACRMYCRYATECHVVTAGQLKTLASWKSDERDYGPRPASSTDE